MQFSGVVLGIPRKVLRRAAKMGVHADCIASSDFCKQCEETFEKVLTSTYKSARTEEHLADLIVLDLVQDRNG